MYSIPHPHSFSDAFDIGWLAEIGLFGKLLGRIWIAFRDEVVHNDPVYVAVVDQTLVLSEKEYNEVFS